MIPKIWKEYFFKEVAKVASGQVDPRITPYCDYLHIGPENIESGSGIAKNLKPAKESGFISGKYLFDDKAIVYSKIRPNLNKVCFPKFLGICSADMYPVWANEQLADSEYLFHVMTSDSFVKAATSASARTGLPKINRQELDVIKILCPPLTEQRKIAEILGTWDEAIDFLTQTIAAKRKLKQGLMQQLLTGDRRFKEFEGSEWKTAPLSQISSIRRGASPRPITDPIWFAETGRGWVRIRDVTASKMYLTKTSQYLSTLGAEKSVKVDKGDFIMSICATIGVPRIVDMPACVHDGFVVIRDFDQYLDKFFLYHYVDFITDKLADSGQPGTQKNLNTTIVGNIEVPQISLAEQEKIAAVLSAADDEITTLETQLTAIKQQKRGLMQQLLTGKKRVKV